MASSPSSTFYFHDLRDLGTRLVPINVTCTMEVSSLQNESFIVIFRILTFPLWCKQAAVIICS